MTWLVLCGAFVMAASVFVPWHFTQAPPTETFFESRAKPPEAAPLCPWRDPQADMQAFFPTADHYVVETRILSGMRTELAQRLGRALTGDENALHLNRIFHDQSLLGSVATRRVKGEYGAIEIVLALDPFSHICGIRLQRMREPEAITAALTDPAWQHSFLGKSTDADWQIGHDIPDVPEAARTSAKAVVDGTRSLLILLAAGDGDSPRAVIAAPHH